MPSLPSPHPCARNIHDITLSYTFYKVEDEDASNLDDAGGVRLHASGPIPAGVTLAPGVTLPPGIGPAASADAQAGSSAAPLPVGTAGAAAAGGG
jgi:hypothetical protein